MSKYTKNSIYSYVEERVNTEDRPVYCSSRFEPIPSEYPACYIMLFDRSSPRRNVTLDFDDEQGRWDIEVQVFSNRENGANEEADEIASDVKSAMKKLHFLHDSETPITNDPSVVRIALRFHRTIGGNDEMPSEE